MGRQLFVLEASTGSGALRLALRLGRSHWAVYLAWRPRAFLRKLETWVIAWGDEKPGMHDAGGWQTTWWAAGQTRWRGVIAFLGFAGAGVMAAEPGKGE
jgi:hypothetical protein